MNPTKLFNKVVVITGASAGLGRATVREFARHGAHIGLLARGKDGLEAAKKEAEELGGKAIAVQTDVSKPEQIESAADKVEEEFGPIDVWINIAMVSVFAPLKHIKPDEFERVTDVTYHGQVYGVMAALKRMLPRDEGTIILGGSALAYRGIPLQSAYCGSKHAIHGFFESLRAELIHDKSNINLSMVQLPAMNTTQFSWVLNKLPRKPKPMGQIFEPEVAAKVIFATAVNPEREVFVGYPTVQTILGNKILPGWLDEYLAKTGYKGQQTDEPKDLDTKNNLWEPVEGDHGARGDFDAQAWDFSPKFWAATHKWADTAIAAAVSVGAGMLLHKLFSSD
jgi:NAD(P)-dependent dehydrogenase (short-subunit alcohol dehydrogenase family)